MLFDLSMKEGTNDNDTWQTLGLATARLLETIGEDHKRDGERDAPSQRSEEEKTEDRGKAVENGLRQIERFENRFRRADRS